MATASTPEVGAESITLARPPAWSEALPVPLTEPGRHGVEQHGMSHRVGHLFESQGVDVADHTQVLKAPP